MPSDSPAPSSAQPTTSAPAIPQQDRIPLLQKVMFGMGIPLDYVSTTMMFGVLWMPYFNIGLGIRPVLLGIVLMCLRSWDCIVDPLIGNLSDNTRTRWGRRRPFMAVGAVLIAVTYPLFWHIPAAFSERDKIICLIGIGMVYYLFFATWIMPYYSLQLELTPNYDERTRLSSWMAVIGKLTSMGGGWLLAILTGKWFIDASTGKGSIVLGMQTGCWFIAGGMLIFGMLPTFFVKERYYLTETSKQAREPFWQSVRESARCKPLWSLIGISFFLLLGTGAVAGLGQYVNIYYIFDGDLAASAIVTGVRGTVLTVTGLLSIPLWTWLGERFDKKRMVIGLLLYSMFGHLLNFVCVRRDMPYLQILPAVFESGAMSALWLFLPSMKADTADYDESNTMRRREGSLNAFYAWFMKVSSTCATGLGGWVLELSGFNAKVGAQPPEVLRRMFLMYLVIPVVIWCFAVLIAGVYPLSRRRMAEIRAELESRRGAI